MEVANGTMGQVQFHVFQISVKYNLLDLDQFYYYSTCNLIFKKVTIAMNTLVIKPSLLFYNQFLRSD